MLYTAWTPSRRQNKRRPQSTPSGPFAPSDGTSGVDVKRTPRSGTADGSIGRKARLRGVASGKTGVRAIAVVPWQREIALTTVRGSSRSGGGRDARCVSQRAEPAPGRLRARARAQLRAEVEARLT